MSNFAYSIASSFKDADVPGFLIRSCIAYVLAMDAKTAPNYSFELDSDNSVWFESSDRLLDQLELARPNSAVMSRIEDINELLKFVGVCALLSTEEKFSRDQRNNLRQAMYFSLQQHAPARTASRLRKDCIIALSTFVVGFEATCLNVRD